MTKTFCCCEGKEIVNWEPDFARDDDGGPHCHWLAGETLMCSGCGSTLKPRDIYKDFLGSPQWKKLRFSRFILDNFYCVDCGEECSDCHHENYSNILDIKTMVSLCHACHNKRHKLNPLDSDNIKKGGWANSINIKKFAEKHNLLNCPVCKGEFSFYIENGFWCCYTCEKAGDLKDFAGLILTLEKNKQ